MESFIRNCPNLNCNEKITYNNIKGFNRANLNNSKCKVCTIRNNVKNRRSYAGENNHMYGRSLKDKWIENYGEEEANKKQNEWKEKLIKNGSKKSNYDCWLEKYGKEEADRLLKEQKDKQSLKRKGRTNHQFWTEKYGLEEADRRAAIEKERRSKSSSGENNPMYGKPSPSGSGNGWSGHYKGVQFRSILELSYLKFLIDNDIKFDNGEKKKYRVEYEFNGKKSYGMDFYLFESNQYIEIKPKKLLNTKINKAKFRAARLKLGEKFKILTEDDIETISLYLMYEFYINKSLIFDKRYEIKFLEYYEKLKDEDNER